MGDRTVPPSNDEIAELIRGLRTKVDGLRDRVNILIAAQPHYRHDPNNPDAPLYAQFISLEARTPPPACGQPHLGLLPTGASPSPQPNEVPHGTADGCNRSGSAHATLVRSSSWA